MTTAVFISWSGTQSKSVAEALAAWLPRVLQAVEPFVSTGTQKGIGWPAELHKRLRESDFGIVCITSENVDSPWLNFEAGALAARFEEARVAPLLLDVEPEKVKGPLRLFQAVLRPDRSQMLQLVEAINEYLEEPLPKSRLHEAFDNRWEALDQTLTLLQPESPSDATANGEPTEGDMVLRRLDSIERQLARQQTSRNTTQLQNERLLEALTGRIANPRSTDSEEMRARALRSFEDATRRADVSPTEDALISAYMANKVQAGERWVESMNFSADPTTEEPPPDTPPE